jgi:phospholipid/cholesterol/gamma-HCH transport system substrate-binding protein
VISAEIREICVGGVAVALLAGSLAMFYSGQPQEARAGIEPYRIFADFNRIDGLAPGADVRLSGIPVGRVESANLANGFRVRITMLIDSDVQLPTDTAASIQTDGLFGAKSMVLDPGGEERMLADGDAISFTQDAVVVGDLLDLIIAEGRAARGGAAGGPSAPHPGGASSAPAGLLGGGGQ